MEDLQSSRPRRETLEHFCPRSRSRGSAPHRYVQEQRIPPAASPDPSVRSVGSAGLKSQAGREGSWGEIGRLLRWHGGPLILRRAEAEASETRKTCLPRPLSSRTIRFLGQ